MDEGASRGIDAGLDRLTIQEAAQRLGVSEGAVRKRVTRGTLPHDKAPDGRVFVYLDEGDRRGVDGGQGEGVDPHNAALISRLEGEVEFLRDQVRRQQEIIAQQAVTMRQLSAPSEEAPGDAETVEEEPEGAEPRSDAAGPQTGAQSPQGEGLRGLRRRILGW
jgi:excisionase family DNA binding protein